MINLCLDVGTLLSPDEIYFYCYRAYDNDDWGFHDDNQIEQVFRSVPCFLEISISTEQFSISFSSDQIAIIFLCVFHIKFPP